MPGFLGASSSGGGTGGEITFPKEFVDPVTKLRVSNPETLIDTDFEYGLQPTKWETVELINNTPSFFSKSGDTTIPNIVSINTTAGSREVIVRTSLEHGLSVGIPINVRGTKSLTADGAYIIGSIPDEFTFTYLARINQQETRSINDLYSSIITGEFFQGSQIRISAAEGVEVSTPPGASNSTLTVKTESPHGFGVNTPFYFLNLNSTISQEFDSSNTTARSFDSSNSATAQTFDGSNTATQATYNLSNDARVDPSVASTITTQDFVNDTITVSHSGEDFTGILENQPLYYNVTASSGFFLSNPRGIVYLKTKTATSPSSTTFTVSQEPEGSVIPIDSALNGIFQIADRASFFAGNNINLDTRVTLTVDEDPSLQFDAANDQGDAATVTSFSGSLVNANSDSGLQDLSWVQNTMVLYTTTGSAASGLSNNTTYWVDTIFPQGDSNTYSFTVKEDPYSNAISSVSGGTGTQKFTKIGVSLDKDYVHLPGHGYEKGDMIRYDYPVGGKMTMVGGDADTANYFFVSEVPDADNFNFSRDKGGRVPFEKRAVFSYTGADQTFTPDGPTDILVKIWGAAGGAAESGGGDAGGAGGYTTLKFRRADGAPMTETFVVVVGRGGVRGSGSAPTASMYGGGGRGSDDAGNNHVSGAGGGLSGIFAPGGTVFNGANPTSGAQARSIAIAGGGGGSNDQGGRVPGGAGGGLEGQRGLSDPNSNNKGGWGGRQVSGYSGSNSGADEANGGPLRGADAIPGEDNPGGGGGYYGGQTGSDDNASSGGGSGYIDGTAVYTTYEANTYVGNRTSLPSQATSDPDWPGNVGRGNSSTGENGYVVIYY